MPRRGRGRHLPCPLVDVGLHLRPDTLHEAGIAVLLDVPYDHTAKGSELGPTLAFRRLDNAAYYHLAEEHRYTRDDQGIGNALNLGHPRTLQLVSDSLRCWGSDMHVDGFRFDLASAPARAFRRSDELADFFELLQKDPVLADVHLIAGPWDADESGSAVGSVSGDWWECNGRYRDTMRRFWAGEPQQLGELAARLPGPSHSFGDDDRRRDER